MSSARTTASRWPLGAGAALGGGLVAIAAASAARAPTEVRVPAAAPTTSAERAFVASVSRTEPVAAPASGTEQGSNGATRSRRATEQAPAPRDCSVAAMGDSLTDEKSHGGRYLKTLKELHPGLRVDNYGKGGNMVNQMRRRFARDVLGDAQNPKPRYTHLIVFGGVNDLVSDETAGRTPQKVARDLTHMYDAARARGMSVVAITVSPWSGFKKWWNERRGKATLELNAWIREQAPAGQVSQVVDAYALLSCGEPTTALCPEYVPPFNDGLHFGPKGHAVLGRALSEAAFRGCR